MDGDMTAEEALAKIREMIALDIEEAEMDILLYGHSIISVTPDGPRRVPPDQFCIVPRMSTNMDEV